MFDDCVARIKYFAGRDDGPFERIKDFYETLAFCLIVSVLIPQFVFSLVNIKPIGITDEKHIAVAILYVEKGSSMVSIQPR